MKFHQFVVKSIAKIFDTTDDGKPDLWSGYSPHPNIGHT
jgi:hypothetical protein